MLKSADILITNGRVLTMNPETETIENGAVAVVGDTITAVGPASDFSAGSAKKVIDANGGIIMPGLINTHTHAAMTLFRGLADDLPLMTWLNEHIFPAEAGLDRRKVYCGAYLACAEMVLSGTTCFCDMYLFEDAVAEAARDAGVRAVVGEVLYDFPSPNYGGIEKGFDYTRMLLDKWRDDPLVSIAVEPHSPYLCAPELLIDAAQIAAADHAPLVIHLSETQSEVETIKARFQKTPVAHLADLGILSQHLVACHCVVLSEADMALLKKYDVKVSHNPESNMKLASGVSPIPQLMAAGICVGLGTDGCSSNNNLDLFQEMDTAAKLHKVIQMDPTVADAKTVLRMATIDAARVLGLDHLIGSLEVGKKADVIVVDTRKPHLTPLYDAASHLVYSARGSDVVHAVINGRLAMADRVLQTIDVERAMTEANAIASEIV